MSESQKIYTCVILEDGKRQMINMSDDRKDKQVILNINQHRLHY